MKKENIDTLLVKFINQEFGRNSQVEINRQTDLFETGLVDSLGVMKLIRFIEATFEYQVPLMDILPENFSSIQNISEYLTNA